MFLNRNVQTIFGGVENFQFFLFFGSDYMIYFLGFKYLAFLWGGGEEGGENVAGLMSFCLVFGVTK